jgi:High potential iron-sulfur protein
MERSANTDVGPAEAAIRGRYPEARMADSSGKIPLGKTNDPPPRDGLSRRRVFQTLVGSAAMVGAVIALAGSQPADAQSKTPKNVAKYQDNPNKGAKCSDCRFFQPPKSCQLVAGDISPNGWCSFFAKKPA